MLEREDYTDYCKRFDSVFQYLKKCSADQEQVIQEICNKRKYDLERMHDILVEAEFIRIEKCNYDLLRQPIYSDLGLFNKGGSFLLSGRYIFPVKDMLGNIIALIGWYNDEKKYITTPSRLFSKEGLFFGLEQMKETGISKDYFICEGIFDSLSLRSLGFNAIAQMGLSASKPKILMYGLFHKLIGVPDSDSGGRNVVRYDKWKLPQNSCYFTWDVKGVFLKDIDDFCNYYEEKDLQELFQDVIKSNKRIYKYMEE